MSRAMSNLDGPDRLADYLKNQRAMRRKMWRLFLHDDRDRLHHRDDPHGEGGARDADALDQDQTLPASTSCSSP